VRRAFAILRAFGPADRLLPLGEVARRASLDKATTRRLLRTLIVEHLIEQRAETREYSVALGALELIAGATEAAELRRRSQLLLAAQVEATRAVAAYVIVEYDGSALCIDMIEGEGSVPSPWAIGERRPLHVCASSRILLANLPPEERAAVLAGALPALTAATPTDRVLLAARLDAIRARDWDLGVDEVVPGAATVAMPVRDEAGAVIAALGIAGPTADMLEGEQPRHLAAMRETVREMERRLGAPSPIVVGGGEPAH
jgi:DNA-binding IclR family transcriptional regulator